MKIKTRFRILLIVLITVSLACSLPAIIRSEGSQETLDRIHDGLTENYVPSPDYTPSNPFNYSPDQMTAINTFGNPTQFTIIFTGSDRLETWIYDTAGYTVVFNNGVKLAGKNETTQFQEGMYATRLGPNQFYRGMGLDEVILSTGRNDFHILTLEGLDKETHLVHLQGLAVGLSNGRVNYVETIPATTETLLQPEDFVPVFTLTQEEQTNEGTHLYQSMTYFSDVSYENEPISWHFRFEADAVYLSLLGIEDEELRYSKIGPNQYHRPADDELEETILTFTLTGFTEDAVVEGEQVQVVNTIDTSN